jgi:DHA1 family bicyclomycin/chloramphenicol resistance-like MFS transporter
LSNIGSGDPSQNGPDTSPARIGVGEAIWLAGFLTALYTISISAVVPALQPIGQELGARANNIQLLVTALIVGMAVGQLFWAPLSDHIGRKPALYFSLSAYAIGSVIALLATNFPAIFVGRLLQGLGAGGARTVTIAMIRDQHRGAAMARIISFVSCIFVVLSVFSSFAAQAILSVIGWRQIFIGLLIFDLAVLAWLAIRQPETLLPNDRRPPTVKAVNSAIWAVTSCKVAMSFTIALCFVIGGWLAYLNSANQIFRDIYGVGEQFPLYFSVGTVAYGVATLLNARLVGAVDLQTICYRATLTLGISSACLAAATAVGGTPSVGVFLVYTFVIFCCLGLTISNLTALTMEPLGQFVGIAAGIISSISWLLGAILGTMVGLCFDGTLLPLLLGVAGLSALTLVVLHTVSARSLPPN